jgi:hypothetical protein
LFEASAGSTRRLLDYRRGSDFSIIGRIGIVDCVPQSPMIGANGKPEQIDRAYLAGIENVFADWVVLNQIVTVYEILSDRTDVNGTATSAAEVALVA